MAINKMLLDALKAISYADIEPRKHYKQMRKMENLVNKNFLRPSYRIWDHEINAGDHNICVRLFSPILPGKYPILIFFHGGGWVTGNIESYDRVCTYMADKTQHLVISVDYRLAPEFKFPAGVEDCYLATKEIFASAEIIPECDSEDITLIGDSAGGNLAAAVSLMARDRGEFMPKKQILIYPSVSNDHSETSPFGSVKSNGTDYLLTSKRICEYMDLYQSDESDKINPYFAPMMASSFENQPKTLIITAEFDPLRDEGEAYGEALKEAGIYTEVYRIPDALHGFFSLSSIFSPVRESYELINNFLKIK